MEERLYVILAGLLFDFNCLNIYFSRDYPLTLLSRNRAVVNLIKAIKGAFEEDNINLTFPRLKELLCRLHNIDPKNAERHKGLQKYYTIYDFAREKYDELVKEDFHAVWKKELKWGVEEYIRRRRLFLSEHEHKIAKSVCLGNYDKSDKKCKSCDIKKDCIKSKKARVTLLEYLRDWREEQEEFIRKVGSQEDRVRIVNYARDTDKRIEHYQEVFNFKKSDPDRTFGLPFPFKTLNDTIDGWKKGVAGLIAWRSGKGKTALALFLELYVYLYSNANILHFNLEMQYKELEARLDSAVSGIDFSKIIKGRYRDEEEFKSFVQLLEKSRRPNNFVIIDVPDVSISEFRYHVRKYYDRWGENMLVCFDNINIAKLPLSLKRHEGVNEVAKSFHDTVKEYNIMGLMLAQFNRDAEGETKFTAKHLRDSDKIMDHFDWALGIRDWGPDHYRLIFMKCRNFTGDYITLRNQLNTMSFEETEKEGTGEELDVDEEMFERALEDDEETVLHMSDDL